MDKLDKLIKKMKSNLKGVKALPIDDEYDKGYADGYNNAIFSLIELHTM